MIEGGVCIYQRHGEYDLVEPDLLDLRSGVAFRQMVWLPEGRHAWLVQWQAESSALSGLRELSVTITDVETGVHLAKATFGAEVSATELENILLSTETARPGHVEIRGVVHGALGEVRLRHLKVLARQDEPVAREQFFDPDAVLNTRWLKSVFIGTTNVCNANCPHCPTNKRMTAHLEKGRMDMDLFERIFRQLDGVEIGDGVLFGLFGEPFEDPQLEERIRFLKRIRPGMPIDIATNAGVASAERVAAIAHLVRNISIHVEASTQEVYDKLMTPLKAREVFPIVSDLAKAAPGRVSITTPLHRGNCHEAAAIRNLWRSRGLEVRFSTLQTRATGLTAAKRYALAPSPGFWKSDLLDLLVIDWDGVVLATCDDFLRRQPLGDLKISTVEEVLNGAPRREAYEALRSYRWLGMPSLYDAVIDDVRAVESFSQAGVDDAQAFNFPPERFQHSSECERDDGKIRVRAASEDEVGHAVFGPYATLPAGRYVARFRGGAVDAGDMRLHFEAVSDFGARQLASARRSGEDLKDLDLAIEFDHERPGNALEFRIMVETGEPCDVFDFAGVTLQRVGRALSDA